MMQRTAAQQRQTEPAPGGVRTPGHNGRNQGTCAAALESLEGRSGTHNTAAQCCVELERLSVVRMGCTGGAIEPGVQMGSSRAIEPVLRMGSSLVPRKIAALGSWLMLQALAAHVDLFVLLLLHTFMLASSPIILPCCLLGRAPRCRPVVQTFACNDDEQRCAACCLVGLPRGTFWGAPPEGAWARWPVAQAWHEPAYAQLACRSQGQRWFALEPRGGAWHGLRSGTCSRWHCQRWCAHADDSRGGFVVRGVRAGRERVFCGGLPPHA